MRFPSGKFAGVNIYWSRYRTYVCITRGWRGEFRYPKDRATLAHGPGMVALRRTDALWTSRI